MHQLCALLGAGERAAGRLPLPPLPQPGGRRTRGQWHPAEPALGGGAPCSRARLQAVAGGGQRRRVWCKGRWAERARVGGAGVDGRAPGGGAARLAARAHASHMPWGEMSAKALRDAGWRWAFAPPTVAPPTRSRLTHASVFTRLQRSWCRSTASSRRRSRR
eukprot:3592512-Prymnesium_polylepis.1